MIALAAVCWAFMALLASLPPGVPRPDPLLLLLVPVALRGGPARGALFGWAAGLGMGLLGPGPLGCYTLVYGLAGYLLGLLGGEQGEGSAFSVLAMAAVGTVMVGLAMAACGGLGLGPAVPVLQRWLPGALAANLVLALPAAALAWRVMGPRSALA